MPINTTKLGEDAPKMNHLALLTKEGAIPIVPGSTLMMVLPEEGGLGIGNVIPLVLVKVKRTRLTFAISDGQNSVLPGFIEFNASKGTVKNRGPKR